MKKNVSGQVIGAQLIDAASGAAFTGAVTVAVTGNGGTQATGSVGSGACTHKGNGFHTYAPAQAETNYDHIAFTFTGEGAVPVTIQVYPSFPQTGDTFDRVGANGSGLSAVPWNPSWDAEVESEVTDALNTYDPPTKAELDARTLPSASYFDPATDTVANVTAVANVTGDVGGNVNGSVNSVTAPVELATDQEVNVTKVAGVAVSGVSDFKADVSGLLTSTAYTASLPTNFAALGINASGHIERVTLVDTTTANTDMRGTDSAYTGTPPTAGEIADAVWDENQSDHDTAGTFGAFLDTSVSGVSTGGVSAEDIATAVRTELTTELSRIDVDVSSRLASVAYVSPLDAAGVRTAVGMAAADLDTQIDSVLNAISGVSGGGGEGGGGGMGGGVSPNQPVSRSFTLDADSTVVPTITAIHKIAVGGTRSDVTATVTHSLIDLESSDSDLVNTYSVNVTIPAGAVHGDMFEAFVTHDDQVYCLAIGTVDLSASQESVDNLTTEVEKIPRTGETHTWTNTDNSETATVAIS